MAVVRLIFRPCVGNHPMVVRFAARNHPSGRSASSSPQGAPISRVGNLKINRARPVKRADGEHRPLQMICNVCGAGWVGGNY